MNEKIIKQVKALPPLPKSVIEVQKITSDPNSSIADLVKVIKDDPMITANLLKVANSPLYGFTRQIKNVDQAVALFGMTTIKGFVISFAIRNSMKFDLSAYGINEESFHDVSIKRNALAINWYKSKRDKLDVISTDSFLLDLGAVIISLVLVSENRAESFKERLNKENRYELEKEFVEADTFDITLEIFKHWHFNEDLIKAVENIKKLDKEFLEESAALDVISTAFNLLGSDESDIQKAIEKVKKYNLDEDKFNKAIKIVNEGI